MSIKDKRNPITFGGKTYEVESEFSAPQHTFTFTLNSAQVGRIEIDWLKHSVTARVIDDVCKDMLLEMREHILKTMKYLFDPLDGFSEYSKVTA